MDFVSNLLTTKRVSVWGGGYLGLTTVILLQSAGFSVDLFDISGNDIGGLKDGSYPATSNKEIWTISGDLPPINMAKINICNNATQMFNTNVHVVSFPFIDTTRQDIIAEFRKIIMNNRENIDGTLFIFQAAEIPRTVEKKFIHKLINEGIKCSYASAFRSDWTIEEFLMNSKIQVISGYDADSLEKIKAFIHLLDMKYEILSSIEEAEIYENAQKAIGFTLSAFVNQLSLSYPAIDMRKMSRLLVKNISTQDNLISIGSLKYNITNSLDHLSAGVSAENYLSILKEAESGNLSLLLKYGDLMKQKGVKKVSILGISSKDTVKDIRFSPPVILAEYLNKIGITVYVDDPYYDKQGIKENVPFAKYIDIHSDRIESDALFVFRDYNDYKFLTQKDIEQKGIYKIGIVIDDVGLFENFQFSEKTVYHIPGDGNLKKIIEKT